MAYSVCQPGYYIGKFPQISSSQWIPPLRSPDEATVGAPLPSPMVLPILLIAATKDVIIIILSFVFAFIIVIIMFMIKITDAGRTCHGDVGRKR